MEGDEVLNYSGESIRFLARERMVREFSEKKETLFLLLTNAKSASEEELSIEQARPGSSDQNREPPDPTGPATNTAREQATNNKRAGSRQPGITLRAQKIIGPYHHRSAFTGGGGGAVLLAKNKCVGEDDLPSPPFPSASSS